MPISMRIVLRGFWMEGADQKAYSLTDHVFVMCDGTDGGVSLSEDMYWNRFNGDVFESDYLRIDGIREGDLTVTVKKDQPIWAEWAGDNEATDLQEESYVLLDEAWHLEENAPAESGVPGTGDAA